MIWRLCETFEDGAPAPVAWWEIDGKECTIYLEQRPAYCDRGNWIGKVFPRGKLLLSIDYQDGWPRYYFDLDRAKLEIEAWLVRRGQAL